MKKQVKTVIRICACVVASLAAVSALAVSVKEAERVRGELRPFTPGLVAPREVVDLGGDMWRSTWFQAKKGKKIGQHGEIEVFEYEFPEPGPDAKWKNDPVPTHDQYRGPNVDSGYLEREFVLDANQAARQVSLNFEGIGKGYKVWINGKQIAECEHGSGFLETCDATDVVKAGTNTLRVLCRDRTLHNDWLMSPTPQMSANIYRPVYLMLTDRVRIADVLPRPQVVGGKVMRADVVVTNGTDRASSVVLRASCDGGLEFKPVEVKLAPGEGRKIVLEKPWKDAKLWTPATPNLCWLKLSLTEKGLVRDAQNVRFGFRDLTWKGANGRALMNGKPFMMRRSSYGSYTFDDAKSRELIRRFKKRGIFGARIFVPADYARFASVADEEGFLISTCSHPGWGAGLKEPEFWPRYRALAAKMVHELKAHPSIVCWGLSNEFGTTYGGERDGKRNMESAVRQGETGEYVQSLDPTRPWEMFGEIELRWHGNEGPMPIRSYHYPRTPGGGMMPCVGRWFANAPGSCWQGVFTNDKPVSVSEDLYHGFQDNVRVVAGSFVGDRNYTVPGYVEASWRTLRTYYEGYCLGGLAAWDPWSFFPEAERNPVFDNPAGMPIPYYLVGVKELSRNVYAGETAPVTLFACNEWFERHDAKLTVRVEAGGMTVDAFEKAFLFDQGDVVEIPFGLKAPSAKAITPVLVRTRLTAGGKELAKEDFTFQAVPRLQAGDLRAPAGSAALVTATNSPLRGVAFAKGVFGNAADALAAKPASVVVHGALLPQDLQLLDEFVRAGGRVLHLEPEYGTPSIVKLGGGGGGAPSAILYRADETRMLEIPAEAMVCWKPKGYISKRPVAKPMQDAQVLWEAVHSGAGLQFADVLWLFRGRGAWLVSTVDAFARFGVEPMAEPFVNALFAELADPAVLVPGRKVVLVDLPPAQRKTKPEPVELEIGETDEDDDLPAVKPDKRKASGPVVSAAGALFAKYGILHETAADAAKLGKPDAKDTVYVIDVRGAAMGPEACRFVKAAAGVRAKVLVLDYNPDPAENAEMNAWFGIELVPTNPAVMAEIPWDPGKFLEVDESCRVTCSKSKSGVMAGINNEDLCWWKKQNEMEMRWEIYGLFPSFKSMCKENVIDAARLSRATKPTTRALTEPGGIFETGAGAVVCTFSLTNAMYVAANPEKAVRVVKTMLNNLGAATTRLVLPTQFTYVDMKPVAKFASWGRKGGDAKWPLGSGIADYRYFPVNRCGWSLEAHNYCPVAEFPKIPLPFDGVYFQLIDADANGGRDLWWGEDAEPAVLRLGAARKVRQVHFLGFTTSNDVPKLQFGEAASRAVDMKIGRNVVFSSAFERPDSERRPGEKWGPVTVLKWTVENPDPATPVSSLTLMNGRNVGIFAVTVEE